MPNSQDIVKCDNFIDIENESFGLFVTDNGSNMKAAFKNCFTEFIIDSEIESDSESDEYQTCDFLSKTPKRVECIDYILSNNLKVCFTADEEFSQIFNNITNIIRKIRRSGKCCDYFRENFETIPVLPSNTRYIF